MLFVSLSALILVIMKRDMDLIRNLLLWVEKQDSSSFFLIELPAISDRETIISHALMLQSAGFFEESQRGRYRISWHGYEFLEKVRDPEIWTKTKDGAGKIGSWSVKLLGEIAGGYIKAKAAALGLPI